MRVAGRRVRAPPRNDVAQRAPWPGLTARRAGLTPSVKTGSAVLAIHLNIISEHFATGDPSPAFRPLVGDCLAAWTESSPTRCHLDSTS